MINNVKSETSANVTGESFKKHTPLTDREIMDIWMQIAMVHGGTAVDFARALELKHSTHQQGDKSWQSTIKQSINYPQRIMR